MTVVRNWSLKLPLCVMTIKLIYGRVIGIQSLGA
jgi:hypothetical protein